MRNPCEILNEKWLKTVFIDLRRETLICSWKQIVSGLIIGDWGVKQGWLSRTIHQPLRDGLNGKVEYQLTKTGKEHFEL